MKKLPLLLGMFSAMCFFSCESSNARNSISQDNHLKIDVNNVSPFNNGVFEGWGTSLCWWANMLGESEALSKQAVELLFSKENGLGLNVVRYNIGGGDNPKHDHIVRPDSTMPGYWKNVDFHKKYEFDWSSDFAQRAILEKIISLKDQNVIFEFFSNSPPYFMTRSGCSSGSISGIVDNISLKKVPDFIEYLVTVTKELQDLYGINVSSLEPMNEPHSVSWSAYNKKQEGCRIGSAKTQGAIFFSLRAALDAKGLSGIIVSGADEYGPALQSRSFLKLQDNAKSSISRINTHTYYGNDYKKLYDVAVICNKDLWVSETDAPTSVGKNNGQMGPALALAQKIIADMNGLKPSAWVIWQAIADYILPPENEGEDIRETDFSKPFWGLAVADFNTDSIVLSKKYYAFAQFTKFIRPGSRIIYTGRDDVIASYSPDNKQVSIVCLNTSETEKQFALDLSAFGNAFNSANVYRTSGLDLETGENCQPVMDGVSQNGGESYSVNLLPYSVTTFVFCGL